MIVRQFVVWLGACLIVGTSLPATGTAATGSELRTALEQMISAQIDETAPVSIEDVTLEQPNLTLRLEKGTLYFLRPIQLDTARIVYGAFFQGRGRMNFAPTLPMEQNQVRRFYEEETLETSCTDVLLLFNGTTLSQLQEAGKPAKAATGKARKALLERVSEFHKFFTIRENYQILFGALRNIAFPRKQPYLLVNADISGGNQVFYTFDPYDREEVKLYRYYKQFVVPYFMELVSSFSVYADSTYVMLNGNDKDAIVPRGYTINSTILQSGLMTTVATMQFVTQMTPVQLVELTLHERMVVDSIRDGQGRAVEFLRWRNDNNRNKELLLALPEPLTYGTEGALTFYYHGDPIEQEVSDLFVDVQDSWYPRFDDGYHAPVAFDMTFKSPSRYGFVASGQLVLQKQLGDTLLTSWKTDSTAFDASFNLGNFNRFQYTLKDLPTLDLYHLEKLHRDSTNRLLALAKRTDERQALEQLSTSGKNMQGQVADDIIGALQVFTTRFGPLPYERLAASEVLDSTRYGFLGKRFASERVPGNRLIDQLSGAGEFSAEHMGINIDSAVERQYGMQATSGSYVAPLFPGKSYANLLLLRFDTFQRPDKFGDEVLYRVHGLAAQWWKHQMYPDSYRDDWLRGALSEYSALVYLQASRGNDQFLHWVKQFHSDVLAATGFLLSERAPLGALALGPRSATTVSRDDYEMLMYRKGALVIHMLRQMLLNLETFDESRFFNMLHDYYTTFRGRQVSTRDFQAMVQKHTGVDMQWFFDQWVYGTDIPKYKFSYKVKEADGKGYHAKIRIEEQDVPRNFKAYVPVEIEFDSGDKAYVRVLVDQPVYEQELSFDSRPKKLRLNPFESVLARVDQ